MRSSKTRMLIVGCWLSVLTAGTSAALAAPGDLLQTFLNPTATGYGCFGQSVAAVGNNVLVGAPNHNLGGAGAAYLFDGATGAALRTFQATPPAFDAFGYSVAAVGNNILVGAHLDSTGATQAGAAYLFDGSTGALLQTFQKATPAAFDKFGVSVAAVGNNVLIGAPYDDTGAAQAGPAYLFDGSTGAVIQSFQEPTRIECTSFGYSVAGMGGNVLIGAPNHYNNDNPASAYLFDGSTGVVLRTFLSPNPVHADNFGQSVAALGKNVLVGAPDLDGAGAAYLFDGESGAVLRTLVSPTPAPGDFFGVSVAAVGNDILVGAPYEDTGATDAGAAYLFDGSTGALLQTFRKRTPGKSDYLGYSLAAVGSNILVGAFGENSTGTPYAGAAYLFEGVPEPATLALLALGGLGLLRRRLRAR